MKQQVWDCPKVWTRRRKDRIEISWDLYPARLTEEAWEEFLLEFANDYLKDSQWATLDAGSQSGLTEGWMLVREEHVDEILTRLLHFLSDDRFHYICEEQPVDVPEFTKFDAAKVWGERLVNVKDKFPGDFGDNPLAGFDVEKSRALSIRRLMLGL